MTGSVYAKGFNGNTFRINQNICFKGRNIPVKPELFTTIVALGGRRQYFNDHRWFNGIVIVCFFFNYIAANDRDIRIGK